MSRCTLSLTVLGVVVAIAPPVGAAPVTVSDGQLAAADWTATVLQDTTVGLTAEVAGWQQPSNGNPDAFRALSNAWTHDGAGSATIVAGHMRAHSDYAPAIDGAIGSVEVSLDVETTSTTYLADAWLVFFPVIQQGSTIYAVELGSPSSAAWSSLSWGPWTASDFSPYAGDTLGPAHPDFSSAGAALVLGVAVQSGPLPLAGTFVTEGGMDNWSVTLHGPTDAGSGGAGGAAGAAGAAGAGGKHGSAATPPVGASPAAIPPRDRDGCGCRVSRAPLDTAPLWLLGALGTVGARIVRRRRRSALPGPKAPLPA
jgi:hypothetical protein